MGALTFDALLRSLKPEGGAPDLVYYLHGDEDILKDEALRALTARAMEAAARDFNVDTRSAADLDAATLRALVDTPPLLAQTRVVVLRGIEQMRRGSKARQELLRYLAAPNPTTVLVLVQSAGEEHDPELARLATTVAVEPLPPERVARWMAHRAKQVGLEIEPDAIAALVGIARPFGLGDWGETAARWARWAEGWSSREVGQALRLARDADRALKSTTVTDEAGIVTQLVLQLGVLRREAA